MSLASVACATSGRLTVRRRRAEDSVLHRVVRGHLETFLAEAQARGSGDGLPRFVERELREFLSCGVLARGFARLRCDGCKAEMLVAFSCKGRGFCPSCCGRRMAERAAHLVDGVLGGLPIRQWVLTLPYRLRYALAWDHRLCRAVLSVFVRAVLGFERRRAARRGARGGTGGAVTAIQRFGSALNTNVHFHTLAAQGVFVEQADGSRRFFPLPAPTDDEVVRLLAAVRRRIIRLVGRHGIDLEDPSHDNDADQLRLDCPVLAEIQGAAVIGRVVTGPRAGAVVQRLGRDPAGTGPAANGPLHAHLEGFDLHAAVTAPAGDRERLEHLCRYVLRPPIAREALELAPDGSVVLRLRHAFRDGTRAIRFAPTEFLEKLASMIPKPRINLLVYHGAFAAHAHGREDAVRRARDAPGDGVTLPSSHEPEHGVERPPCAPAAGAREEFPDRRSGARAIANGRGSETSADAPVTPRPPPAAGYTRPAYYAWADLLRRTFAIDVLACAGCGGRLRLLATITDARVIRRILRHLNLPTEILEPAPARPSGWWSGGLDPAPLSSA